MEDTQKVGFPRFMELPLEIRNHIWKSAGIATGPRVIEVNVNTLLPNLVGPLSGSASEGFQNSYMESKPLPLLNSAIRAHMRDVFWWRLGVDLAQLFEGTHYSHLYFSPWHDTLFFPYGLRDQKNIFEIVIGNLHVDILHNLKHLAIDQDLLLDQRNSHITIPDVRGDFTKLQLADLEARRGESNLCVLNKFRSLETITIVLTAYYTWGDHKEWRDHQIPSKGDAAFITPYGASIQSLPLDISKHFPKTIRYTMSNVDISPERNTIGHPGLDGDDIIFDYMLSIAPGTREGRNGFSPFTTRKLGLESLLSVIYDSISMICEKDPGWKVPRIEIKALKRGGVISK